MSFFRENKFFSRFLPLLLTVVLITTSLYLYFINTAHAGQVAFDFVGPSSAGTSCTACASLSWSHTVSGSNTLLTASVGVGTSGSDSRTVAVTYNGIAMTSAGKVHANNGTTGFVELFYLKAPSSGANTVQVTITGGNVDAMSGGSVSFTGVDQTTPVRNITTNFGSDTTPTVTISSAAGNMVVDGVSSGCSITSSNQTSRWITNVGGCSYGGGPGAQSTAAGASSVVMSYAVSSDDWGIIGMDVVAASNVNPHVAVRGGGSATASNVKVRGGVGGGGNVKFR